MLDTTSCALARTHSTALDPCIPVFAANPGEIQRCTSSRPDSNDSVGARADGAHLPSESLVVVQPGVLVAEGVDEHQRVRSGEAVCLEESSDGPMEELVTQIGDLGLVEVEQRAEEPQAFTGLRTRLCRATSLRLV